MRSMKSKWPPELCALGHPFPGRAPEGLSAQPGWMAQVSSPSTASGLLALEGAPSAPAVHSASSQPTEGPLF